MSSDFMQTDYSNSVDAALTMVMGGDLVKVVMWYCFQNIFRATFPLHVS